MPLIRYIQKLIRDPNFLVWRDTIYINADGRPQYLSLKLISGIDALLQGKISEYVFQSEFREVKFSCDEIKVIGHSLVAEYLFYEGSGTILHDTSGNNNYGTIYGATWSKLTNGKNYLSFDGIDDYVEIPNSPSLNPLYITIEALIYPIEYKHGTVEIVDKTPASYRFGFNYYGKTLFFECINVTGHIICSYDFAARTKQWFHLVATYDGSYISLYENSELKRQCAWSGPLRPSSYPVRLGKWAAGDADWFCGYMTCVRIFNRGLTTNKIQLLYKLAKIMVPELP